MARSTFRTAAEVAAFKAANRAAAAASPAIHRAPRVRKPVPARSDRQQFAELVAETEDMIRAARRQGHFHAIPALLQRHTTLSQWANNQALR